MSTKAMEWIKVEDRLPPMVQTAREVTQSDYVLVYTDRDSAHEFRVAKAYLCSTEGKSPQWKSAGLGGNVTHWMPLPEPPKP